MSQSLSKLWTHVIFSTKQRRPFLVDPVIRKRLHRYLQEICTWQQCPAVIVGGVADHIHLLVSIHRNKTVAQLVENLKKSSSKWIKTLAGPSNQLAQFQWQSGYSAFSVSQSLLTNVRLYIENQEQHHKTWSYQEELRVFLKSYEIVYEEKYVWD